MTGTTRRVGRITRANDSFFRGQSDRVSSGRIDSGARTRSDQKVPPAGKGLPLLHTGFRDYKAVQIMKRFRSQNPSNASTNPPDKRLWSGKRKRGHAAALLPLIALLIGLSGQAGKARAQAGVAGIQVREGFVVERIYPKSGDGRSGCRAKAQRRKGMRMGSHSPGG
jgi:hypothetical protein